MNLVNTLANDQDFKHHILFDGDMTGHFLKEYSSLDNLVILKSGSGARSFVDSVEYAINISKEGDYIYFLEDDYLHQPGWTDIVKEGTTLGPNTYFTLYDCPDKYPSKIKEIDDTYQQMYTNLVSKIITTDSVHWRTVPSTTDTFIMPREALIKYKQGIVHFSSIAAHSLDNDRSLWLGRCGLQLWSCIPGYSAHITSYYEAPTIDWEKING